ncbi:MAG: family 10 glycosylhydrolase [Ruminococcus sp.]|nr:family 10 glycosylhydrolase [Ruminococcus sp.]
MKKNLLILLCLLLCACSSTADKPIVMMNSPVPQGNIAASETERGYSPLNYDTVKAVWISCIELAPMLSAGREAFSAQFEGICRKSSEIGFNTLFVHIRAFSDAYYPSELYPPTKFFGSETFDALEIMTEAAHSYDLSFHAWINPLRCETPEVMETISDRYPVGKWYKQSPERVSYVSETKHCWLDPACPEVRELIAEGAAEIVRNYDVDGIHIDDYFYPTTDAAFDESSYAEFGSGRDRTEWRTENCSLLVSGIYKAVKREDPRVLFGIAPQGNLENNYMFLCADVKRWCTEEGFCDYICPQLYFGYKNRVKPFAETLDVWRELCAGKKKLLIGIGAYKTASEDEFIRREGIIADQISDALSGTDGAVVFSYNSLFGSVRADTERELISAELHKNEKLR